jgi:hypothetical protein
MKKLKSLLLGCLLLGFSKILPASGSHAITFVENKGQWNQEALFKADLPTGNVFLLRDGFLFTVHDKTKLQGIHENGFHRSSHEVVRCHTFKVSMLNTAEPEIIRSEPDDRIRNYFLGEDSSVWRKNVRGYAEIVYRNVYPEIDLRIYSDGNNFKYDFILHHGALISDIQLRVEGVTNLRLENDDLVYVTEIMSLRESIPLAYGESKGGKHILPCHYRVDGRNVGFEIPGLTGRLTEKITIDPVLLISTYSGSSATTYGSSAAYDSKGNLFIGAMLFDTGWPYTLGAYDVNFADGIDVGITKFDTTGSNQIWSTYLGGNSDDVVLSMIANDQDELFVFGHTNQGFPVTNGAFDVSANGLYDIFVAKLSSSGNSLLASTYVGGSSPDGRSVSLYMDVHSYGDIDKGEIQLDHAGNPVIGSLTSSDNFPVSSGAFQAVRGGGIDACVFKLNSSLTQLIYSTYLGGSDDDACYGLSLDVNGNPVLTGGTFSTNFPVTQGAYQTAYAGGMSFQFDSFVSVLDASATGLIASTYFGFNNSKDKGYKTALDTSGNIYVFGNAEATLPVSAGVYSNQNSGNYVLKFNPSLSNLLKCTAYGDGGTVPTLQPIAFHVDACNRIYCAGFTSSVLTNPGQFPITAGAQQSIQGGTQDAHVMVFEADFASVLYASYLGGAVREHTDAGSSRFDRNGVLYLGVCTQESFAGGFPVTPNAFSPISQTPDWDMTGVKWDFEGCARILSNLPSVSFYSSDSTFCNKKAIDFFDLSSNFPTSWRWYFPGAIPDTSSRQNPTGIFYPSAGVFNVTMVACNSAGCDSVVFPAFITEFSPPAQPVVTQHGDSLCTDSHLTYEWYEISNPFVILSTSRCFMPSVPGNYSVQISDSNGCQSSSRPVITSVPDNFISAKSIWPNPTNGLIHLELFAEGSSRAEIVVTDDLGRVLKCFKDKSLASGINRFDLDINELAPGLYNCTILLARGNSNMRLVKY